MPALGRQLRCPAGSGAEAVGDLMYGSNRLMIRNTIDHLDVFPGARVLELGFGNGKHLPYLHRKAGRIDYTGVDTSPAMINEAKKVVENTRLSSRIKLFQVSGDGLLGFSENSFDRFFTVNTLYFWPDVVLQLREIRRVLLSGGQIALSYIDKAFGEQLPFTRHGFSFMTTAELEQNLSDCGFSVIDSLPFQEKVPAKDGQIVRRPYTITLARKP